MFPCDQSVVTVTLPEWVVEDYPTYLSKTYPTDEDKMALAVELSQRNVAENTGGPFGSAIFDGEDRVVGVGVNRVVPLRNSTVHGEICAIMMAQRNLQTFALPSTCQLVTSCEPCAMCLGATLWGGVGRLVCGATKHDAQAIGFDEGPVFEESYEYLRNKGIEVVKGIHSEEAAGVLKKYGETGVIYNGTVESA